MIYTLPAFCKDFWMSPVEVGCAIFNKTDRRAAVALKILSLYISLKSYISHPISYPLLHSNLSHLLKAYYIVHDLYTAHLF